MIKDLALFNRAIKERWPIDEGIRNGVLNKVKQLIHNDDPKIALKAMDIVTKLDNLNIKQESLYTVKLSAHIDLNKLSDNELESEIEMLEKQLAELKKTESIEVRVQESSVLGEKKRIEPALLEKPNHKREL